MNWQSLDLNLLRVLDAMLSERSTTRTGDRVGLSQPAVSSALNRLRHTLGDPLFVREGNRMVPTPFAESIEGPLRQALEAIERTVSRAAFDPAQSTRTFRLLGDNLLSVILLPSLVDRLARQAPGVRFQLMTLNPRPIPEQFADGSIDLAFAPDWTMPDWVERREVMRVVPVVAASRDNARVAGAKLRASAVMPLDLYCSLPHVQFSPEGILGGEEDNSLASLKRRREIVLTVPDFFSLAQVVAETGLVGSLPPPMAHAMAGRFGLVVHQLPFAMAPIRLHLFWHRRHTDDPEHRWMRGLIADLFQSMEGQPKPAGAPRRKPVRHA